MLSAMKAIGYVRVSTEEQGDEGASLEAQAVAIRAHCDRSDDLELVDLFREVRSARDEIERRPTLTEILRRLEDGDEDYDALIATKVDRLSRSSFDFQLLMARALKQGWDLIVLDYPLADMTTAIGKAMAQMAAVFAELESNLNSERTKAGIQQKKDEGTYSGGRPKEIDPELEERISRMGGSNRAIAAQLTAEGIPTPTGGRMWGHSTVGAIRMRNRG
jgi:DNA invertase Pin-like site-specific DNA recombinase